MAVGLLFDDKLPIIVDKIEIYDGIISFSGRYMEGDKNGSMLKSLVCEKDLEDELVKVTIVFKKSSIDFEGKIDGMDFNQRITGKVEFRVNISIE
ncbi:MAG: hypothetical protein JSW07_17415 [bacterium]|nr:MAG: hypothetical protein JSW07_17415 [bacterium]